MPDTSSLPAVKRPNGKLYRPRRVAAHVLADENAIMCGALVLGTHDKERAYPLARDLVIMHVGRGYVPAGPACGWWRDGMANGERCWIDDSERGAAGVLFGRIEETGATP